MTTILLSSAIIYLILGLFWYGRETTAQQAVRDTCGQVKLAYWMATVFLILSWPWWLFRHIQMYLIALKTMGRR